MESLASQDPVKCFLCLGVIGVCGIRVGIVPEFVRRLVSRMHNGGKHFAVLAVVVIPVGCSHTYLVVGRPTGLPSTLASGSLGWETGNA